MTDPAWQDPQTVAAIAGVTLPTEYVGYYPDALRSDEWEQTIADHLDELGSTREAVAAKLITDGVTGNQHDGHRNPVANWLARQVEGPAPEVAGIRLEEVGDQVRAQVLDQYGAWQDISVPLPEPVDAFLTVFDASPAERCAWPALLDRSDIAVSAVAA
ncbi:hypothetical protein [Polymorphospora lycopeni]|uniref:Uncharacterized protein n=1 Tax=Polymorphospora lycopeni TaxID=3140240 RepID=A0ABV5CP14_9ACTN